MLIVRVELHSALTRKVTEIARMHICNVGGNRFSGMYEARTLRGRTAADLDRHIVTRTGAVRNYPRLDLHVWHLVGRALAGMGYVKPEASDLPDQPGEMAGDDAA